MSDPLQAYWAMRKDDRWLSSPYEVGGRATDVTGIGWALGAAIRERFPMNEVPLAIVADCKALDVVLGLAEARIYALINSVSLALTENEVTPLATPDTPCSCRCSEPGMHHDQGCPMRT